MYRSPVYKHYVPLGLQIIFIPNLAILDNEGNQSGVA